MPSGLLLRLATALTGWLLAAKVVSLPLPQAGEGITCDGACSAILLGAIGCEDLPIGEGGVLSTIATCLCNSNPNFVPFALQCVSCAGGTIFPNGEGLDGIQAAIGFCPQFVSAASVSTTALDPTPLQESNSGAGVSSLAVSSTAGGESSDQAVRVTEAATVPITITAWAPSGYSPSLTHRIEATGGPNTTIEAIVTTTVTTAGTFTATVTNDFILGPSAIVQFQGNDGFDDIVYCELNPSGNGTVADCIELQFAGTSLTAQDEFTLTGATSAWVAYPLPTGATFGTAGGSSASASPPPSGAGGVSLGAPVSATATLGGTGAPAPSPAAATVTSSF